MAGNQRTQPEIKGVLRVCRPTSRTSRSSKTPPSRPLAYYTVRVALPLAEVARLKEIRLLPGMPAEVFIQTHDRTPLQYSSRCRSRLHALFASDDQVAGREPMGPR
jgi:HlyD family secretion protein